MPSIIRRRVIGKQTSSVTLEYGDGSLNTVIKGYANTISLYLKDSGTLVPLPATTSNATSILNYQKGNGSYPIQYGRNYISGTQFADLADMIVLFDSGYPSGLQAGDTTVLLSQEETGDGITSYVCCMVDNGNNVNVEYKSFRLKLNGEFYRLDNAVSSGLIEPLVYLVNGAVNSSYAPSDVLKLYNTDDLTTIANYPEVEVAFIPKKGVKFQGFSFYDNKAVNRVQIFNMNNYALCLNPELGDGDEDSGDDNGGGVVI